METLCIVVYRMTSGGRWKVISEGEFKERRLAENLIECKRATGWGEKDWDFGIVEGPIINPEQRIERGNQELGAF